MKNQDNLKNRKQPKTNFFRKTLQNTSFLRHTVWRGVRDFNWWLNRCFCVLEVYEFLALNVLSVLGMFMRLWVESFIAML